MGHPDEPTFDMHTHVVPQELTNNRSRSRRWPSVEHGKNGEAAVVIDGKVFRRIDSRCWDVSRRLADLDEDGTTLQALSPMPELLSHWLDPAEADDLAAIVNGDMARMIAAAPGRFAGLGMVCAQDVKRAVRGLEEIKRLGLDGIEIGSHINGTPLGDAVLAPLYEAAQDLDLGIFVHPLHPVGMERVGGPPEVAAAAAFPMETALAAVSLLVNGVLTRFPRLRVLLSHGGGALPWIAPRLDVVWSHSDAMRARMPERPSDLARRFWYDTIVYDPDSLRFLANEVGADRLLVGSDYPFAIRQKRPGRFVEEALGPHPSIAHANALRFLGGTAARTDVRQSLATEVN